MGAWGPGIYQDDVALDIKGEYIKLLQEGKSTKEANQEIINNNADYFTDEEDVVPAILALADIECKKRCLKNNRPKNWNRTVARR